MVLDAVQSQDDHATRLLFRKKLHFGDLIMADALQISSPRFGEGVGRKGGIPRSRNRALGGANWYWCV